MFGSLICAKPSTSCANPIGKLESATISVCMQTTHLATITHDRYLLHALLLSVSSDVMERMIKAGCAATFDFEWLAQLRFVFSREEGPFGLCSVRQTNCQLEYSYEYQVNTRP